MAMNQTLLQDNSLQLTIRSGAERTELNLSRLDGKRPGIVANHSSIPGRTNLIDSLATLDRESVQIVKIFGPAHGYRGQGEDAVPIADEVDHKSGIPNLSLYGQKHKPTAAYLADL